MSDTMDQRLAMAQELLRKGQTGIMLSEQGQLPRLPVNTVEDAIQDYLRAAEALLSEEDFAQTKLQAQLFLETDGPALQKMLVEYEAEEGRNSYLEDFWEDAYLTQRSSIAINTNPFFTLEDDPTPARTSQIARATTLVWSSLLFCQSVRSGKVEPDVQRTTPLCMAQYPKIFGTTRIPLPKRDKTVFCEDSKHIVVMSRGLIYSFHVFDANMEMSLTREMLAETLREIREDSGTEEAEDRMHNAVGVLTSDDREVWAHWRKHLEGDELNRHSLNMIDTALFVLCLDDTTPPSPADMAKVALHGTSVVDLSCGSAGVQRGTCINRWYDKSLQIIVCQNGAAGVNFEHSVIDGHTVLRFASDVFTETILRFAETIRSNFARRNTKGIQSCQGAVLGGDESVTPVAFTRISWNLGQDVVSAMLIAESKLSDRIPQVDLRVLEFANYGKNWIVDHKLSPDALVQIAFQVAYFRVYRACVCTYETIMTKQFFHGRTEAGFVVTHQSKALCQGFHAANSVETLQQLLKSALDAHVRVVRLASQGRGIRTLFALKCMAQQCIAQQDDPAQSKGEAAITAMPALYADAGWKELSHNILSTSNCGNPALRMFGFGPVVGDGFGIGYIIKDDNMQFCVTSYNRQTARFISSLEDTLITIRRILNGNLGATPMASSSAAASSSASGAGTPVSQLQQSAARAPRMSPLMTSSPSLSIQTSQLTSNGSRSNTPTNAALKPPNFGRGGNGIL